ncbi:hypothetical protein MMC07_002153 [Pseudocyphellaria aurata]|nr:hypothetical protein [Pseudocyphellaria aurata]
MNLLEAIQIVLQSHQQQGFDEEKISAVLESRGITLPKHLVQNIIGTLYHVDYGAIYDVEWAMTGFHFIVDRSAAGDMSREICVELYRFGYHWDHDFVCQIIFAHVFWLESGNGGSW